MKKALILLLSALLLVSAAGCGPDGSKTPAVSEPPAAESPSPTGVADIVSDYYPIQENALYLYDGEGSEYAAFQVYLDYSMNAAVQERISSTAMTLVKVVTLADGKAVVRHSRENTAFRENFLGLDGEEGATLLMAPIAVGTHWTQPDGGISTITDIAAQVETPSGSYEAVCVETQSGDYTTLRYFAKGVGLVKTVFRGGEMETYSVLTEIRKDVSLAQTVRFYYPEAQSGKIYYRDSELGFLTNDNTAQKLATAYKEAFSDCPGTVLTKNAAINSLWLDQATGILHIDLNAAFVAEMDGGSAYESLVLQCLANTFGRYYDVHKVIPTIDGALYESRHMVFEQGAYLTVNTANVLPVGTPASPSAPAESPAASEEPDSPTESPTPPTESPAEPTESPVPPTESPVAPTVPVEG